MRKNIFNLVKKSLMVAFLLVMMMTQVFAQSLDGTVYPLKVEYPTEEKGVVTKTYLVETKEEMDRISKENISYSGKEYKYLDMTVKVLKETLEYVEDIKVECENLPKEEILKNVVLEKEVETKEGFKGIVYLDEETFMVNEESIGTGYRSAKKQYTKQYPGLSNADLSFIPKMDGKNPLVDVTWSEMSGGNPYDPEVTTRYTAYAVYEQTYSVAYNKGNEYNYTGQYKGTLEKVTGYECTVVFEPNVEMESTTRAILVKEKQEAESKSNGMLILVIILAALLIIGIVLALFFLLRKKNNNNIYINDYLNDSNNEQK